ncbi:nudC domain containing [Perkinsus olseni]|nr:nudC domain containing [Perkinsus olseni]
MRSKEDKMGFPLGYSEDMVISIMRRYQLEYLQQNEPDEINPLKERWRKVDGPGRFYNRSQSSSADGSTPRPEDADGAADAGKTSGHASDSLDRAKHISTWNGARTAKYYWTQTLNDLTVEVSLRANTKGKDLSVTIKPDNISIKYKGDGSSVLVGDLDMSIVPLESSWLIEDGDKLILSLDKAVHTWWKCVLRGDEQIDTTKVESTKTVSELDESSQGAVRKMLFDQNQRAQGKPTSDQIRMQEIMKDAWDADNSPFKGQPFDPNLIPAPTNATEETWEKFEEARLARAVEAKRGDSDSKGQ